MLASCYKDIAPGGGTNLLLFLGNLQLFRHLLHEMKKQEGMHKDNPKTLERYYFDVRVMSNLFFYNWKSNHDLAVEFKNYAYRYLEVKTPQPDDIYLPKVVEIGIQLSILDSKKYNVEKLKEYAIALERIYEKIKNKNQLLAAFRAADALMVLYSIHPSLEKKPGYYARTARAIVRDNPKEFAAISAFYELESTLCLSETVGGGGEEISIARAKEYLTSSSSKHGHSLYHMIRLFPRIVEAGEYAWAKRFIANFFPYDLDLLHNDSAIIYSFLLMVYYTHSSNYAEGERSLERARTYNKGKKRSIQAELQLRCYDVFFTAMHGDHLETEHRIETHLRYARRYKYHTSQRYYYHFLKHTGDLIKCIGYDAKKASAIRDRFSALKDINKYKYLFDKIYTTYC
jgi:hypothetical protein